MVRPRTCPSPSSARGDRVLVKPGEKVPTDGVDRRGRTSVNEAMLTGESQPVEKGEGDVVIGGVGQRRGGASRSRCARPGDETYLAQVIDLVRQAQESRSRSQDLANRAALWLTVHRPGGRRRDPGVWLARGAASTSRSSAW